MSTRFNKLAPKPGYIVTVKAVLEQADELSLRDISRRTGLSQTQSSSALDYLIRLGQVELRRQNHSPTRLFRLVTQAPRCQIVSPR